MKIASEIKTQSDLNELKSYIEIFVVNKRVHELAELSHILNITKYFQKCAK